MDMDMGMHYVGGSETAVAQRASASASASASSPDSRLPLFSPPIQTVYERSQSGAGKSPNAASTGKSSSNTNTKTAITKPNSTSQESRYPDLDPDHPLRGASLRPIRSPPHPNCQMCRDGEDHIHLVSLLVPSGQGRHGNGKTGKETRVQDRMEFAFEESVVCFPPEDGEDDGGDGDVKIKESGVEGKGEGKMEGKQKQGMRDRLLEKARSAVARRQERSRARALERRQKEQDQNQTKSQGKEKGKGRDQDDNKYNSYASEGVRGSRYSSPLRTGTFLRAGGNDSNNTGTGIAGRPAQAPAQPQYEPLAPTDIATRPMNGAGSAAQKAREDAGGEALARFFAPAEVPKKEGAEGDETKGSWRKKKA
ncbi:hypothetical protein MKZ38_010794 [Zalerion maritima]|uniref:Uncharacterized protein n=1 Tax=Zalerion maritima TaxID=339359 RepID=A0AAD5S5W8_9PEZI|nr:hypothetical protein MKZ38_010794 [Zalerion maritima]